MGGCECSPFRPLTGTAGAAAIVAGAAGAARCRLHCVPDPLAAVAAATAVVRGGSRVPRRSARDFACGCSCCVLMLFVAPTAADAYRGRRPRL